MDESFFEHENWLRKIIVTDNNTIGIKNNFLLTIKILYHEKN